MYRCMATHCDGVDRNRRQERDVAPATLIVEVEKTARRSGAHDEHIRYIGNLGSDRVRVLAHLQAFFHVIQVDRRRYPAPQPPVPPPLTSRHASAPGTGGWLGSANIRPVAGLAAVANRHRQASQVLA